MKSGRIYRDGPVDQCSLSRDWCGILHRGECQVIGLYDDSVIDVHISDNQQVSSRFGRFIISTQSTRLRER